MRSMVFFDDSLPVFSKLVVDSWGADAISTNLFLRDVSGRLTFVLIDDHHSPDERASLALRAATELKAYVDGSGFAVATPDEIFDDRLKDRNNATKLQVDHEVFRGTVYLIDRRMVGADWLRNPAPSSKAPTRLVFASLKGGVGRSTALCVLAAHLAGRGKRVLAIDLDLEAPGLGNLLLPDGTLPEFGLLDFLVETEVGSTLDDQFFVDIVGPSWLGGGHGRVDVIPAIGRRSLGFPGNVLAKIARAYLAGSDQVGETRSFSDYMRAFVDYFSDALRYDAILIDARAGLHETTAAAIVGLGAEVLLFGLDHPQTFAGYELLFAQLSSFSLDSSDSLRERLHVVQSKAAKDSRIRARFSSRMEELLRRYLWPPIPIIGATLNQAELKDTFDVEWSEENSSVVESLINAAQPPIITSILDDDRFRSFDPLVDRDSLAERLYSLSFGQFLEMAEGLLVPLNQPI